MPKTEKFNISDKLVVPSAEMLLSNAAIACFDASKSSRDSPKHNFVLVHITELCCSAKPVRGFASAARRINGEVAMPRWARKLLFTFRAHEDK